MGLIPLDLTRSCFTMPGAAIFSHFRPSLSTEWEGFFFDGGMGLTPLVTPLTMTHHIYSDDFQELLPLSIHWMGGLFLAGRNILWLLP
jgi:hypothetical protein